MRQLHAHRARRHLLRELSGSAAGRYPAAVLGGVFGGSESGGVPVAGPNPPLAGILAGIFPFGVGAVYTGQYAKGLAHLVIFACWWWEPNHAGEPLDTFFGLGIAFFVLYQIIDAVRTARAIQLGLPAPDPLGLGQAFGAGEKFDTSRTPKAAIILIGLGLLFFLPNFRNF